MAIKFCNCCQTTKHTSFFGKDKYGKTGFTDYCKECKNRLARERASIVGYKKRNDKHKLARKEYYNKPEVKNRTKDQILKKTYNITLLEYNQLLAKQNGVCAICYNPEKTSRNMNLAVDHCHKSGMIRGLLCSNCNRAIGLLKDSSKLLASAIKYLGDKNER